MEWGNGYDRNGLIGHDIQSPMTSPQRPATSVVRIEKALLEQVRAIPPTQLDLSVKVSQLVKAGLWLEKQREKEDTK